MLDAELLIRVKVDVVLGVLGVEGKGVFCRSSRGGRREGDVIAVKIGFC